jgi:hypothetical protein
MILFVHIIILNHLDARADSYMKPIKVKKDCRGYLPAAANRSG